MSETRQQEIIDSVMRRGIEATRSEYDDADDVAFAELVEDIRSWDAESQHRTGTDGDRRTSEVLVSRLARSEVAATIVEHPFQRRVPNNCYVQVGDEKIEGIPLFDGGVTPGEIAANLVTVGSEGEIGVGLLSATGGDQASRLLLQHRNSSKYRALIGVSRNATPGIAMLNGDSFSNPRDLPVLLVDGEHEPTLRQVIEENGKATININFETEDTIATNVETTVEGQNTELAPLVVMTPKSSWWTSTAERCGGIVAWLACIRDMATYKPDRTVIFTANTGHELGHVGLDRFLEQNNDLAANAHCWVHLGANFASNGSQVRIQYSSESLKRRIGRLLTEHKIKIASETDSASRPGGEARNIFDAGGNYVSLLGSNSLFHHPDDRMLTNVDFARATRTCNAVVELVRELSAA